MKTIFALLFLTTSVNAADHVISQKDEKFDKAELTINVGDTVNFKNDEATKVHNVFSLGPKNMFELQTQKPGSSSPIKFNEEGETEVECAIHPKMKLKIHVKKK